MWHGDIKSNTTVYSIKKQIILFNIKSCKAHMNIKVYPPFANYLLELELARNAILFFKIHIYIQYLLYKYILYYFSSCKTSMVKWKYSKHLQQQHGHFYNSLTLIFFIYFVYCLQTGQRVRLSLNLVQLTQPPLATPPPDGQHTQPSLRRGLPDPTCISSSPFSSGTSGATQDVSVPGRPAIVSIINTIFLKICRLWNDFLKLVSLFQLILT